MTTRAEFILSSTVRDLLHPGTIMFFEWTQDHVNYMVPKTYFKLNGLYFRQRVVNVDEMLSAKEFFTNNINGLRGVKDAFRIANLEHIDTKTTLDYAFSINDRVCSFVKESGGIDMLPFHPNQRLTFRVQPYGLWSETATAIFYQHFRAGYMDGYESAKLVPATGKEKIELSYGILENGSNQDWTWAEFRLVIPQKHHIDHAKMQAKPQLVWYENEDPNRIHYAPGPAEYQQLQMEQ